MGARWTRRFPPASIFPAPFSASCQLTRARDGRMIISIESGDEDNTSNIFEAIRQMPGVISAALVYHQYETDPDEEA
ncbi:MAG: hypothetical protein CVU33_09680 [Betaproteobacteria bacterium HGW-Betaproteobacteria-6]|nr:MAG: hypothetical protein CVU33_09680 [Betaproteobacteria bacterium HGW-Betaproteobacteria-6]